MKRSYLLLLLLLVGRNRVSLRGDWRVCCVTITSSASAHELAALLLRKKLLPHRRHPFSILALSRDQNLSLAPLPAAMPKRRHLSRERTDEHSYPLLNVTRHGMAMNLP
jgi:hypothetical protein